MGLAVTQGLIVSKVEKDSSAEKIGILPRDVILEVNQQRLEGMDGWKKITRGVDEGNDAIILIIRGRSSAYVVRPGKSKAPGRTFLKITPCEMQCPGRAGHSDSLIHHRFPPTKLGTQPA